MANTTNIDTVFNHVAADAAAALQTALGAGYVVNVQSGSMRHPVSPMVSAGSIMVRHATPPHQIAKVADIVISRTPANADKFAIFIDADASTLVGTVDYVNGQRVGAPHAYSGAITAIGRAATP